MYDRERELFNELCRRAIPTDYSTQINNLIASLREQQTVLEAARGRLQATDSEVVKRKALTTINQTISRIRKLHGLLNKALVDRRFASQQANHGDFGADFDRLMALPPVTGIRAVSSEHYGDELEIQLTATVKGPRNEVYDLGDWTIRFGPRRFPVLVTNVRNTYKRKNSDRRGHPNHYPNGGTYTFFCAGERLQTARTFAARGDFFGVLSIYVHAINGLNTYDRNNIRELYPRKGQ